MTSMDAREARLLFILSRDYGEIGNVMYILKGQEFSHPPTLLMPAHLHTINRVGLPGKPLKYESVQDIVRQIKHIKPDIVFLNSGYLLAANRMVTVKDLAKLIDLLHKLGCRVVTSDPFQGLMANLTLEDLHPLLPQREWVYDVYSSTYQVLQSLPHYYTYPLKDADTRFNYPCLSCRNLALEFGRDEYEANSRRLRGQSRTDAKPRWLLILSTSEFKAQGEQYTAEAVIQALATRIEEALDLDRHVTLIGSPVCVEMLAQSFPLGEGVDLMTYCSYAQFFAMMIDAEYVFYWNILPNSFLLRVVNQLPTFFFDQGHMILCFKPLYKACVLNYFHGWQPTYLDQFEPLSLEKLQSRALEIAPVLAQMNVPLHQLPSPQDMLNQILQLG